MVLNALAIAIWVVLLLGLAGYGVRLFFEPTDWLISVAIMLSLVIGMVVALTLQARSAAILGAGQLAFGIVTLAIQAYFGAGVVRGAEALFTIMGAGTLGAMLGAAIHRRTAANTGEGEAAGPWLGILRALRLRNRLVADVLACALTFAVSELVVRSVVFVDIVNDARLGHMNPLHPFDSNVTDYAFLAAAALGVMLGAVIAAVGSRLAFRAIVDARRIAAGGCIAADLSARKPQAGEAVAIARARRLQRGAMSDPRRTGEHAGAGEAEGDRPAEVFSIIRDSACAECGQELGKGRFLRMEKERPLCMACADMDHLVFLASGDAALTRRATKYSTLSAVVLRFSRARNRYERQGVLVEPEALGRAEGECLADADARERARERAAERREQLEAKYVQAFARAIGEQFPGCPAAERRAVAEHACLKYSGRVGRSASARELDPEAIELAVRAHVRHEHSGYDDLLMAGLDRGEARATVAAEVLKVLERWRRT